MSGTISAIGCGPRRESMPVHHADFLDFAGLSCFETRRVSEMCRQVSDRSRRRGLSEICIQISDSVISRIGACVAARPVDAGRRCPRHAAHRLRQHRQVIPGGEFEAALRVAARAARGATRGRIVAARWVNQSCCSPWESWAGPSGLSLGPQRLGWLDSEGAPYRPECRERRNRENDTPVHQDESHTISARDADREY